MTPAEKQKTWARWVSEGLRAGKGWAVAVGVADEALSALEWRIREGRFDPAVDLSNPEGVAAEFRDLTANRDEWMERARKAESLLKEALRLLGVVNKGHQHQGGGLPGVVLLEKARYADLHGLLARARQEGFSDGE